MSNTNSDSEECGGKKRICHWIRIVNDTRILIKIELDMFVSSLEMSRIVTSKRFEKDKIFLSRDQRLRDE